MPLNSDFDQLERLFERLNRRNRPGRIFRESIRRNDRLRRISRQSPLGRAGVNTASVLGAALADQIFSSEIFTGGNSGIRIGRDGRRTSTIQSNSASELGGLFSAANLQNNFANIFTDLFEGFADSLLTRRSTSVRESERSTEASRLWDTSRSQQNAELAAIVQRGLGEL